MTRAVRLYRSWLFAPGDSERKMAKAAESAADVAVLDLEDGVSATEKAKARATVLDFLAANAARREKLWVRINPIQGPLGLDDLVAVTVGKPAGIVLPKPRGRADADALDRHLTRLEAAYGIEGGATQIMLLATELPESLLHIGSYVGTPRLAAMGWSAEDLATALGASDNRGPFGGYDFPYELARGLCLIGAAAANAAPIETIHADFRDEAGLKARVAYARRQGFRGMLAVHPAQVDVINQGFAPSAEEIAAAREVVDLFALDPGAGVIVHHGAMLDAPHLARAKAVLAQAEAFKPR